MIRVLFILGTRPEAIKFAPLIKAFKTRSDIFSSRVCITSQHKEMLQQVMHFFEINADIDLDIMKPSQSLTDLTANLLSSLQHVILEEKPDVVFVQGDTTTAFTGALASFYQQVPVAHVEAGLRSFNKYSPFPEEVNRKIISSIASFHFCPTVSGDKNLRSEGFNENIYVTGNTVVDALFNGLELIKVKGESRLEVNYPFIDFNKKILLVTCHRRESFGVGFENICLALKQLAERNPELQVIYPVHLNPNVQDPVKKLLKDIPNIFLLYPLDYENLLWVMSKSYIILTDSGGIQEEAPALGKPVCVMRDITERTEGIDAGSAILVGTKVEAIINNVEALLLDEVKYKFMSEVPNPYGDGKASERIVEIIKEEFTNKTSVGQ